MRTLFGLVFSLFFLGFFLSALPLSQASELSQKTLQQKSGFLLVGYEHLENGYDPQAIMNKWQGKVLNESEQTNMRPSSDNSRMYGNGTRTYPESSYMYPPESNPVPTVPTQSTQPTLQPQSYYPQYAPQPYPQQYAPQSHPSQYAPQPYLLQPAPYPAPYYRPTYPQHQTPPQMYPGMRGPYGQIPLNACFCE